MDHLLKILVGDCREKLKELADESVHCVITSPPYWGLRDYGTASWEGGNPDCDHLRPAAHGYLPHLTSTLGPMRDGIARENSAHADEAKRQQFRGECGKCGARRIDNQIGLEATPELFVAAMVDVFREVRRVLRPEGTAWLNIGDSYTSGGRDSFGSCSPDSKQASHPAIKSSPRAAMPVGLKPKDLVGIPWALAKALRDPYYTGRIKDERDRVWLAAIIDGEGCFFIHKRKAGSASYAKYTRADGSEAEYSRTADTFGVGLEICNTNKAIIDRVHQIVGGGTFTTQGPEQNARRKQIIYRWRVAPNEAKRIAQEVYPYLVAKQRQARLIFNCPSTGDAGARAHQAMMDLHNGAETEVDHPAPPSLFEEGWFLRQEIIWNKKNPMPESVTDRCTKAHEQIFLLSKSERYFCDMEAIKEPASGNTHDRTRKDRAAEGQKCHPDELRNGVRASGKGSWKGSEFHTGKTAIHQLGRASTNRKHAEAGSGTRNKRSVWTVASAPYAEAHFATYPPELIKPCILAGTSARGCCAQCGAPWERIVEKVEYGRWDHGDGNNNDQTKVARQRSDTSGSNFYDNYQPPKTVGWQPSCKCDCADVVPCTVLDPFGGSGTTGQVALELGRAAILIELNAEYAKLAEKRTDVTPGLRF